MTVKVNDIYTPSLSGEGILVKLELAFLRLRSPGEGVPHTCPHFHTSAELLVTIRDSLNSS